VGRSHSGLLSLTPAEMKVCQFIQTGASSKEMAASLNLSAETIQTHRKHIRKKLGLTRDVNLYRYLQELQLSE
ncbi:MAG TPA: helix-turn-helix transcriptional regulator, partial [Desulfopila sp.]|nr:helix-turn-helix transcriptional regulator [Desulfopila sp.]